MQKILIGIVLGMFAVGVSVNIWQDEQAAKRAEAAKVEKAEAEAISNEQTERQAVIEASAQAATVERLRPEIEAALLEITEETGFEQFFGDWSRGQGMFIPHEQWNALSTEQQADFREYAGAAGLSAIVVGALEGDEIRLDQTVWP